MHERTTRGRGRTQNMTGSLLADPDDGVYTFSVRQSSTLDHRTHTHTATTAATKPHNHSHNHMSHGGKGSAVTCWGVAAYPMTSLWPILICAHTGGVAEPFSTPDHGLAGTGGAKRRFPTGGCAKGIP